MVAASWRRSLLAYGLEPWKTDLPYRLSETQFRDAVDALGSLVNVARPHLADSFRAVGNAGCSIVLSDSDGVVVDQCVNDGDALDFEKSGLTNGAVWSEQGEGTNGIGTAIAERRTVVIHQDQHFLSRNIKMSCVGAPIFDERGELVAAIDVSSCRADQTESAAMLLSHLVTETARRIESDYFCHRFGGNRIVLAPGALHRGPSLLAVDRDDLVIGATRRARESLNLTDDILKSGVPVGDLLSPDPEKTSLANAERAEIRRAIARCKGNMTAAAQSLGISRATLYRRLREETSPLK